MAAGVDRGERRRGDSIRLIGLHGALLLLLLVPVFPRVFFQGEIIAPGEMLFSIPPWKAYAPAGHEGTEYRLMSDIVSAFFPYYAMTGHALDQGEWPLWNPFEFAGMPLLANAQTAVFYPPRLLHAFLDMGVATTLYILLKLWLCGMTAFWCGRVMRFGYPAAALLSVAWMLSSYNLIWCNWSLPDVSVWLPVIMLGIEKVFQRNYHSGFFAMALGGTLILLAGHPETAFAMSFGAGIYMFVRIALERQFRAVPRMLLAAGGAWLLALGVCAAQILPLVEYLQHSWTFSARPAEGEETWYRFSAIASFFIPRFFGASVDENWWGHINSNVTGMLYPGMLVWGLIFALFAPGRLPNWGRRVPALVLASLVMGGMAFYVPWIGALNGLPVFSSTLHAYHIVFALFAMPLLAAHGLEHWLTSPRPLRHLYPVVLGFVLPGLLIYLIFNFHHKILDLYGHLQFVQWEILKAVALVTVTFAVLALLSTVRRRRPMLVLCLALLVSDLLYTNRNMNPTMEARHLFPDTKLTRYLQDQPRPFRVGAGEGNVPTGFFAVYGIEEWLAYDGLYPERMMRFQTTLRDDVWTAMEPISGKEVYLHDPRFPANFPLTEQPDRFELITSIDGLEIYRNKRAFPRAFLVGGLDAVDRDEMFRLMRQETFDPAQLVLTDKPPADGIPPELQGPGAVQGSARVVEYATTRAVVEATLETAGVLVLGDAYYPGWRAYVNGAEAEIFPAYYIYRALMLEPGTHRVEFVYGPMSFYLGLAISTMSLFAGGAAALVLLRRSSP